MAELNTEEKILQAAEGVFVRDGFDGARMQDIADEAGINKAMLHYYFRSKQKLFEEVFRSKILDFLPQVGAKFFSDAPVMEKIEFFIDSYLELLSRNPSIPVFVLCTLNKKPGLIQNFPYQVFQGILEYFQMEIEKGTIRKVDPRQFFLTLLGMCVFPYLSKPVASHMMQLSDEEYFALLQGRREELIRYVRAILLEDNS
jgi:TetR/AcrR family transcriptional regulator